MKTVLRRVLALTTVASALFLTSTGNAFAHTGEDASSGHVIVEVGLWALGAVAVVALLVLVFWIRARLQRRSAA